MECWPELRLVLELGLDSVSQDPVSLNKKELFKIITRTEIRREEKS